MNAEHDIRAGLLAALRGDAALNAQVNRVHDGVPEKSTPPTLIVGECVGSDWGTKDRPGRELRIAFTIDDEGETTNRIGGIMALADAAVRGVAGPVAGWEVASMTLMRSRLLRLNSRAWSALLDYRIRVLG